MWVISTRRSFGSPRRCCCDSTDRGVNESKHEEELKSPNLLTVTLAPPDDEARSDLHRLVGEVTMSADMVHMVRLRHTHVHSSHTAVTATVTAAATAVAVGRPGGRSSQVLVALPQLRLLVALPQQDRAAIVHEFVTPVLAS